MSATIEEPIALAASRYPLVTNIEQHGFISTDVATAMRRAVGLRNIVARGYAGIDYDMVEVTATSGVEDLSRFAQAVAAWVESTWNRHSVVPDPLPSGFRLEFLANPDPHPFAYPSPLSPCVKSCEELIRGQGQGSGSARRASRKPEAGRAEQISYRRILR